MGRPARNITCPGCGAGARHYAKGLCRSCYGMQPEPRAKRRWRLMIYRCTNPNDPAWKDYGGRGIKVCPRWLDSFDAYYADVGDAPDGMSLDRIDNDGDYEPGNVRWADARTQTLNQRNYLRSKTECPKGHPYDAANTYLNPQGRRECRTCNRDAQRRYEQRQRAKEAS